MVKAGILDQDSIPPRGGDNSNLPDVASISYTWKKLRRRVTSLEAEKSQDAGDGSKKANGITNDITNDVNGIANGVASGVGIPGKA